MKKPNVVIIMSDQHNKKFMSCAGHPVVRTPAIDSIAARGTRFENAYCASPLCCPSRMAFMSGQRASTLRCYDNMRQMHSDIPTFAHMFSDSGYETVLAGRMHFNGADQRHGFEKRIVSDVTPYAFRDTQEMVDELLCNGPWYSGPHPNAIRKSGPGKCAYEQFDQLVASTAGQWITDRQSDQPFMLTVGFVLPHSPFVASQEDFDTYDKLISEKDLPEWQEDLHPEIKRYQDGSKLNDEPRVTLQDRRRTAVAYHAMCASLDRQVKVVLDALEAKGLAEDTIIVYTSDHGEQLGEHGLWWKNTFYEGAVGVPMVIAGPGVPRGQTCSQNVSLIDLGQTLLDMTDCKPNPMAQGKSFKGLFEGRSDAWDDTVYADNLWPFTSDCLHRMVKRGPWKLMHFEGFEPMLFNLDQDPDEMNDRSKDPAAADVLAELMTLLKKDWDPQAIIKEQKIVSKLGPMHRANRARCDMPEPDVAWLRDLKVENYVDTTR